MIRALLRASLLALSASLVHAGRATEGDEAAIKGEHQHMFPIVVVVSASVLVALEGMHTYTW